MKALCNTIFVLSLGIFLPVHCYSQSTGPKTHDHKPNVILIFCDDLGYGDLGCYGSDVNNTPNLDLMAEKGMRFTDFYSAAPVCSPSRAALMTGCYPKRVGLGFGQSRWVLFPGDSVGLNPEEMTIPKMLQTQGFNTGMLGKWHLGDQPEFLPTNNGFDSYFGIPYSNDMEPDLSSFKCPPLPVLLNGKVVDTEPNQVSLTGIFLEKAKEFIYENRDHPFFLYFSHFYVHTPIYVPFPFLKASKNGPYGAAVEYIDYCTGEIINTLKELGIDDNTLIIFTSDNGSNLQNGGSNGYLRGDKGSTWEGGMREPCIVRFPGKIPADKTCNEIATTMDLLPTFAGLAGTKPPADRIIDGRNIWPLMAGEKNAKSPHKAFYYYQIDQLQAVRSGPWKLHLPLKTKRRNWGKPIPNSPLQLYNLDSDIAEKNNVADKNPDVVKRLLTLAEKARD
ncbi:MAG: sulfatase, partial [Bacteroidales bacterium]|nr:sulfatase [Bacteroidales bacterium]